MKKSVVPTLYTMLPYIIIFTRLRNYGCLKNYKAHHVYLMKLPFMMPLVGHTPGWLGGTYSAP